MEKIERVNKYLERNWWNYEIYIKGKIEENETNKEEKK